MKTRINVYVTKEEKEKIEKLAKKCRMSVSSYLAFKGLQK